MQHRTSLQITSPTDPVSAYMGGPDANIPLIDIGDKYSPALQIGLGVLGPADAARWLVRLAEAATALAEQVSRERVSTK